MADTAIQMLLKRLRGEGIPVPYAPVPDLGPLSTDTSAAFAALSPEPVLPRYGQPSAPDMSFVNQYAGAAPTAPVLNDPTTIDKLAAILGGIGYGPQYGMALREERERPQREFEAKQERYEERRTRGLELAERRSEREADRANRAAELAYEREFNVWLKKTGVRDAEAKERMRQAFDIQKLREAERIADERQAVRDKAQQERDARLIAKDYGKLTDNPKIALELGRYYAGLTDKLSSEAAKFESVQNKLAEARTLRLARIAAGGGARADGRLMAVLENGQLVPASLVNRETGRVILDGRPVKVVNYVGGGAAGTPQQPAASQLPSGMFPEFSLTEGLGAPQVKLKLNKQQQARFDDIKRDQPEASDERILKFMRLKGWY